MNHKRAEELIKKYEQGECSPEEIALLESWFLKILRESPNLAEELDINPLKDEMKVALKKRYYKRRIEMKRWSQIAAAVILIAVSFLLYPYLKQSPVGKDIVVADMPPGSNKAKLILASGKAILLDSTAHGQIAQEGNSLITKVGDGVLKYQLSTQNESFTDQSPLNEIQVPNGGQYHLVLPDGTNVWLNAGSSLKYAAQYIKGRDREVILSGEAYFEVAKQVAGGKRVPFTVKTAEQEIHVLGTHFNVNTYRDEPFAKTTLIEGKVAIRSLANSLTKELSPGQEALFMRDPANRSTKDALQITAVNTRQALAWKNGLFIFDNIGLKALMRQIGRWYDVDVEVDKLPDDRFYGEMSRDVPLSKLLEMIEIAGNIKFKLMIENNQKRRLVKIE